MDTFKKLYELFRGHENVLPEDFARVIELSSLDTSDMAYILRLVYLAGKKSAIQEFMP